MSLAVHGLGLLGLHRIIHYAWIIVIIAAVMQVVSNFTRYAFGIFVPPLTDPDTFGWSQGSVGLAYSLQFLVSAACAPLVGWAVDRYGARPVMFLGAVMSTAGLLLTGAISELWEFYVYFGVLLGAAMSVFFIAPITAVSVWFRRKLGLGIGLMWALPGLGPAVLAPLVGFLLVQVGWATAFFIIGIGTGSMMLILTFLFRSAPADIGLRPYGATGDEAPLTSQSITINKIRTRVALKHMRRTNAFWNLPAIHFLGCVGHAIVLVYSIPMATQQGMSLVAASGILGVLSLASIFTRFTTPVIAERMGSKVIMAICFLLQGLGVVALFFAQEAWHFYLFAVVFGFGFGGEMTAFPIINRQYYGNAPTSTLYGWEMLGASSGMALGGWLGGVIFDITGAYTGAIALSIAASLGGVIAILMLEPTSRNLIEGWEESLPPEARLAPQISQARDTPVRVHLD